MMVARNEAERFRMDMRDNDGRYVGDCADAQHRFSLPSVNRATATSEVRQSQADYLCGCGMRHRFVSTTTFCP